MNFEISARNIELTNTLRDRVERRFRFVLGRFSDRIERVRVVFSAETGPAGGEDDNCCRIEVDVHGQLPPIRIEWVDSNFEVVVDWVVDRVGRAVARTFDPAMALPRKPGRSKPRKDWP
jgi:ribosome-associated translation inhibitor RaiA